MSTARRHHNIFFYYRGPSSRAAAEADANRQVEDNATKALINVLELCDQGVAKSFLREFTPGAANRWRSKKPASYYLQSGPEEIADEQADGSRSLLGISIRGEPDDGKQSGDEGSRIDAAICTPTGDLIAIETKVVDLLDGAQLARHRKRWGIPEVNQACTSWGSIWRWARAERTVREDAVSQFLLDQLCEYLDILGFGRWTGFHPEDFEQFRVWSWESQPVIKARVATAWIEAFTQMEELDRNQLGKVRAGNFPNNGTAAWAQTNDGESVVNLTLELVATELQLNVVAWPAPRAKLFEKEIGGVDASGFELVVFEREAFRPASGRPYWQRSTQREIQRFSAAQIRKGAFERFREDWAASNDPKWRKLAYHLRVVWPESEVISLGESISDQIAVRATQAMPILRALNGWSPE